MTSSCFFADATGEGVSAGKVGSWGEACIFASVLELFGEAFGFGQCLLERELCTLDGEEKRTKIAFDFELGGSGAEPADGGAEQADEVVGVLGSEFAGQVEVLGALSA